MDRSTGGDIKEREREEAGCTTERTRESRKMEDKICKEETIYRQDKICRADIIVKV